MSALHISQNGRLLTITREADGAVIVACGSHPTRHRGWKKYRTEAEFARYGAQSMACYRCEREHAESVQHAPKVA